jgi:glycosyltransferase involved in cell wall biosynthesis
MMRIAFLAEPTSGNGFYRGIGPMAALAARGHRTRAVPVMREAPLPPGLLDDVDVLHIHRYHEPRPHRLAREARARGAAVVWDDDDHLAAIPKGAHNYRLWRSFDGQRRQTDKRRLLRIADLVTAPSAHLTSRLCEEGAVEAAVIGNFLPDALLRPDRVSHPRVTIGWSAGLEHQIDVDRLPIVPVLQRLLDERDDVDVIAFGLGLPLRGERYRHIPYVPLEALTQHLAVLDVGIAPLADIEFNRARSDVKLKEYAAAGVPWLASPTGPYAGLGEQHGGRLVADDRWHEQLTRLVDKPRERRRLVKRGAKWVAEQTLSRNAGAWEDAFGSAIDRVTSRAGGRSRSPEREIRSCG